MKVCVGITLLALMLGLAAFVQSPSSTSPQGTSPSSTQAPSSQPQSPDMSGTSSQGQEHAKGEKKLKGCIESQGGQFVLQEKSGKQVTLTGAQDLSSHVGHTVTVHGTPSSGADTSATASGAGTASAGGGEQFMVSKIDMVSDTCKDKGDKSSDTKQQ